MKALDLIITDVNFRLTVVEHEGHKWVPVNPICGAIGLIGHKQVSRINGDPRFTSHQLVGHDTLGREQIMTFIPLQQLEGFLYTINSRKSMDPKVASRLLEFQKGLTVMIHKSFNGEMLTNEVCKSLVNVIQDLKQEMIELRQHSMVLEKKNELLEGKVEALANQLAVSQYDNQMLTKSIQHRASSASYDLHTQKYAKKALVAVGIAP